MCILVISNLWKCQFIYKQGLPFQDNNNNNTYLWHWGTFWAPAAEPPVGTDTAPPPEWVPCSGWLLMSPSVSAGHSNASLSTAPPSGHCTEQEQRWARLNAWVLFWGLFKMSNGKVLVLENLCVNTAIMTVCTIKVTNDVTSVPFSWDWSVTQHRSERCSWCQFSQTGNCPLRKEHTLFIHCEKELELFTFLLYKHLRFLQKIGAVFWVQPQWEACGSYGSSVSSAGGSTEQGWWGWPRPCSHCHRPHPPLYCHTTKRQKKDKLAII